MITKAETINYLIDEILKINKFNVE